MLFIIDEPRSLETTAPLHHMGNPPVNALRTQICPDDVRDLTVPRHRSHYDVRLGGLATMLYRILDPVGGDLADHPMRRLRLNLRRVELMAAFEMLTVFYEFLFSFHRLVGGLQLLCIVYGIGSLIFLIVARRGQRRPTTGYRHLPETFLVFLLLITQVGAYLFAASGRLATGYSFTYLICAAVFLIPARRFALIGAATFLLYAGWTVQLDFPVNDRVANLANTLLILSAAMAARFGLSRLEQVNEEQRMRIIEQNQSLKTANASLARQNAELGDLMAIAAHDLRSPLFGLRSVLDLARGRPPTSAEEFDHLLGAASSSVTSMVALVSRLLDVHEIESRQAPMLRPKDLTAHVRMAVTRIRPLARDADVEITVREAESPVIAWGHADSIAQMLDNLLSNAIRFSPAGTQIKAIVGRTADGTFIEIVDEGVGIPDDEQEYLFHKFRRGATPPLNGSRGSGLGLYIVHVLARNMGAVCDYRPVVSGGSSFRLTFRAVQS